MTIEEAIKTSIDYETRVRDLYHHAVKQVVNPAGKRVLEKLAEEEQDHLDYLNSRLDHWNKTGQLDVPYLKTVVPSKEAIEEGIEKVEQGMVSEDRNTETEILKRALDAEKETSDFYKRMVNELPAEGKKLFERFVEIEEGHVAIVQAEINMLSGVGYWFDMPDVSMEAG